MCLAMVPITDANNVTLSKPLIPTEECLVVLGPVSLLKCVKEHLLATFVMPMQGCIDVTTPLLRTSVLDP